MTSHYTSNGWLSSDNQFSHCTASKEADEGIHAAFNNSSEGVFSRDHCGSHDPHYPYSYNRYHASIGSSSLQTPQSMPYSSWPTRPDSSTNSESSFTPSWSQFYLTSGPLDLFASHPDSLATLDLHNTGASPRHHDPRIYTHDHNKTLELLRVMNPDDFLPPNLPHPVTSAVPYMGGAQILPYCARYVHPFIVFELFCRKPAIPTDQVDEELFPPDEWAEIMDDGKRRCNVKGWITYEGRAEWKDRHVPCGHLLGNKDNYRRHLLHFHLGIRREDGKKQNEWIEERWHEAWQYQ